MRLGLLATEAAYEVTRLISGRSDVNGVSLFKDGSISIDGDVTSVIEWLEREYDVHLVVCDEKRFVVASIIEQIGPVAPAVAQAAPAVGQATQTAVASKPQVDPKQVEKIAAQDPTEQMRNAIIAKLSQEKDPKKFKEMIDKLDTLGDVMHRVVQDKDTRQKILAATLEKLKTMDEKEIAAMTGQSGIK